MPDPESTQRRLITRAERIIDLCGELRAWADQYPPDSMPPLIQAILDAADDYENGDNRPNGAEEDGAHEPRHE